MKLSLSDNIYIYIYIYIANVKHFLTSVILFPKKIETGVFYVGFFRIDITICRSGTVVALIAFININEQYSNLFRLTKVRSSKNGEIHRKTS